MAPSLKWQKKMSLKKQNKTKQNTQPNSWRDYQILVNITTKNLTTVWQRGNYRHISISKNITEKFMYFNNSTEKAGFMLWSFTTQSDVQTLFFYLYLKDYDLS